MSTTTTRDDGVTITETILPWSPEYPTGSNWLWIEINNATPEFRAAIERFAEQLRVEDPGKTVIVKPA